jgi:hypothetical protein
LSRRNFSLDDRRLHCSQPAEVKAQRQAALIAVQDAFMDREQRQIAERVAEIVAAETIGDAPAPLAAAMIISRVSASAQSRSMLKAARLDYIDALASVARDVANALPNFGDGVSLERIISALRGQTHPRFLAPASNENSRLPLRAA